MCMHGTYEIVSVINKQPNQYPKVDACIAEEVQWLNDQGIITLGSCCGHGNAGEIIEWENEFGKWKSFVSPPHVLIDEHSKYKAESLGYRAFPYFYSDGRYSGVLQMFLNTGCLTRRDCDEWHKKQKKGRSPSTAYPVS